ncbi:hypothetical protein CSUI_008045 [Cystoisospora suis]|uniref:Uncharacterized protein n=1 Tax=Cystoisospora suis TaxID=483139 RepID=A0A2C6KNT1_9APIC|nr:hypothetical protein CSUI_008045 [Cystoisospora suis]
MGGNDDAFQRPSEETPSNQGQDSLSLLISSFSPAMDQASEKEEKKEKRKNRSKEQERSRMRYIGNSLSKERRRLRDPAQGKEEKKEKEKMQMKMKTRKEEMSQETARQRRILDTVHRLFSLASRGLLSPLHPEKEKTRVDREKKVRMEKEREKEDAVSQQEGEKTEDRSWRGPQMQNRGGVSSREDWWTERKREDARKILLVEEGEKKESRGRRRRELRMSRRAFLEATEFLGDMEQTYTHTEISEILENLLLHPNLTEDLILTLSVWILAWLHMHLTSSSFSSFIPVSPSTTLPSLSFFPSSLLNPPHPHHPHSQFISSSSFFPCSSFSSSSLDAEEDHLPSVFSRSAEEVIEKESLSTSLQKEEVDEGERFFESLPRSQLHYHLILSLVEHRGLNEARERDKKSSLCCDCRGLHPSSLYNVVPSYSSIQRLCKS